MKVNHEIGEADRDTIEKILKNIQLELNVISRVYGICVGVSCYSEDPRENYAGIFMHKGDMMLSIDSIENIAGSIDSDKWKDTKKKEDEENGEN